MSYGSERVLSHFDAYDADGTRYVIEEYVTVHDWLQGEHVPVEWAGPPRLRLADRTPVERGPRDQFWFRDGRAAHRPYLAQSAGEISRSPSHTGSAGCLRELKEKVRGCAPIGPPRPGSVACANHVV